MNKVLLAYWPLKGNVEYISNLLAEKLADYTIVKKSIQEVTVDDLKEFDNWIIGGSTVGSHVWMDADDSNRWHDFFGLLGDVNMNEKVVSFFGLGDQILYPNHFVDGLGVFQEEFSKVNANIVGQWPIEGYTFTDSEGVRDKYFFGLALDEDQQDDLTEGRISQWLDMIKKEFK